MNVSSAATTAPQSAMNADRTARLIDAHVEQAQQYIGNASIKLDSYRGAGFRAMSIKHAITALESALRIAATQEALEKMRSAGQNA